MLAPSGRPPPDIAIRGHGYIRVRDGQSGGKLLLPADVEPSLPGRLIGTESRKRPRGWCNS